jgi:hypothetical protein
MIFVFNSRISILCVPVEGSTHGPCSRWEERAIRRRIRQLPNQEAEREQPTTTTFIGPSLLFIEYIYEQALLKIEGTSEKKRHTTETKQKPEAHPFRSDSSTSSSSSRGGVLESKGPTKPPGRGAGEKERIWIDTSSRWRLLGDGKVRHVPSSSSLSSSSSSSSHLHVRLARLPPYAATRCVQCPSHVPQHVLQRKGQDRTGQVFWVKSVSQPG